VNNDGKYKVLRWLITPPEEPTSPRDVIAWWERRRLIYNLVIGAIAVICFVVYYISITTTGVLEPGEDALEPLALMAAPLMFILINVCYTAGWLLDAPVRLFIPSLSSRFTLWLFILGFAFSLLVVSFPAVYWGAYRCLQLLHAL
jgi:hypothetical protein